MMPQKGLGDEVHKGQYTVSLSALEPTGPKGMSSLRSRWSLKIQAGRLNARSFKKLPACYAYDRDGNASVVEFITGVCHVIYRDPS